jgi:DNA-binding IclR family transcriptional regulator
VSGTAPIRLGDRLVAIVESFLDAPTQTLSDVSAACGTEPSTTTRYLRLLVEHGWLERDERTRAYSLGVRLIEVGHAARNARPLRQVMLPYMRELVTRFDETVNLAVHQAGQVVIIEALESGRSIRRGATIGDRDDWSVSSLGKAILAHLPRERVLELLAEYPPTRRTPNTLTTQKAIFDDLELVRKRGYALDDEEAETGLKCIGVPIRDHLGVYSYALSVSGPTARMDERFDEIVAALRAAADAVGRRAVEDAS